MTSIEKFRYNLTAGYLAVVFTVLPIFFVNMYFNISQEKWACFILCSAVYIVIMLIALLLDDDDNCFKPLFSHWSITEYALVAFLLAHVISTLISNDLISSFIGDDARYHGLSNIFVYAVVIIFIRRYFIKGSVLINVLAIVGAFVSFTAVCQYLTWDPIGMYEGVTVESVHRMISTIGNRNIFAGYLSMILPLSIYLYISSASAAKRITYGIFLALGFAGAIAGNSDSVYIGVGAGLVIMLAAGGLSASQFKRIPGAFAWGSMGAYLILTAAHVLRDRGYEIRPSQGFTAYFTNNTQILLRTCLVCLILYVFFCLVFKNNNSETPLIGKKMRMVNTTALVGSIGFLFVYVFSKFPFPDEFGSYRGFIWRLSINDFKSLPLFRKLFGYGPESLLQIYNNKYYDEMIDVTGVLYDNVHCEPLEYLITTGIVGFAAYMILAVSIICKLYKKAATDSESYLYLVPVFAYFAQSFVNIAQSATTPIYFLLIALGLGFLQPDKTKTLGSQEPSTQQ